MHPANTHVFGAMIQRTALLALALLAAGCGESATTNKPETPAPPTVPAAPAAPAAPVAAAEPKDCASTHLPKIISIERWDSKKLG
ncbi:MAG TPA: hypothetical protein VL860_11625, partial [Planctomycetota bacterium]|nr:hypothetical protein [Planctomycetota bacterium]